MEQIFARHCMLTYFLQSQSRNKCSTGREEPFHQLCIERHQQINFFTLSNSFYKCHKKHGLSSPFEPCDCLPVWATERDKLSGKGNFLATDLLPASFAARRQARRKTWAENRTSGRKTAVRGFLLLTSERERRWKVIAVLLLPPCNSFNGLC